ncbi:hypothetical protein ACHAWF_001579 [Thalassiosira exigua]
MRWMIELGQIDITTEVSLLSSHLAYSRKGHMEAALHVMSYLKGRHNSRLALDPTYPTIDESKVNSDTDWTAFYGDVTEAVPPNAPEPHGKEVELRLMFDSDHVGDKSNSKIQATIEGPVFGAEFVAMKHIIETVRGIHYKLRMMGVPISGSTYIYGDNMSVINNTSKPESVSKKKSNSICYHAVQESVASGERLTTHIPTLKKFADLLTNICLVTSDANWFAENCMEFMTMNELTLFEFEFEAKF